MKAIAYVRVSSDEQASEGYSLAAQETRIRQYAALYGLDIAGIAASTGSACTAGSLEPSHVLAAMGYSADLARGALRLTLGRENTEEEVEYAVSAVAEVVRKLRREK
mgnify:CR=1 FL=1